MGKLLHRQRRGNYSATKRFVTARGNPAGRPHIDVVTCSKSGAGSWTLGRNFSPRFRPTKARSSHYVTRDTLDLRRIGSLPTRLAPHRSSAASNCADAPRGGAKLPGEQWISLYAALARLSSEWGIGVIADEIVRAVLVDGELWPADTIVMKSSHELYRRSVGHRLYCRQGLACATGQKLKSIGSAF